MNRIKSIDGLRAISILMVIIGHAGATISPNFHQNYFLSTMGYMGVLFFFVISGYLITKLMLIEQGKKGQISIKKFYVRRIIRIFPIFYVYILTVVLLKHFPSQTCIPAKRRSCSLVFISGTTNISWSLP